MGACMCARATTVECIYHIDFSKNDDGSGDISAKSYLLLLSIYIHYIYTWAELEVCRSILAPTTTTVAVAVAGVHACFKTSQ